MLVSRCTGCCSAATPFAVAILVLPAQASLVIKGTRVIYNADSKGATVEISNTDDFPNIMQAWIDTDPENKSPENAKAPFIITPAVARLDPKSSQTLRIIYTGDELPKDRESVFYLNVLQIPAQNSAMHRRISCSLCCLVRSSFSIGYPSQIAVLLIQRINSAFL